MFVACPSTESGSFTVRRSVRMLRTSDQSSSVEDRTSRGQDHLTRHARHAVGGPCPRPPSSPSREHSTLWERVPRSVGPAIPGRRDHLRTRATPGPAEHRHVGGMSLAAEAIAGAPEIGIGSLHRSTREGDSPPLTGAHCGRLVVLRSHDRLHGNSVTRIPLPCRSRGRAIVKPHPVSLAGQFR